MMMAVLVNVYFNNDDGYGGDDDDGLGYNAGKFKFWMTRG